MVDTVAGFTEVNRRQRRDVTDIDLTTMSTIVDNVVDNVKYGVLCGMGWAIGILGRGKDMVSDEVGGELRAHSFSRILERAGRIEIGGDSYQVV